MNCFKIPPQLGEPGLEGSEPSENGSAHVDGVCKRGFTGAVSVWEVTLVQQPSAPVPWNKVHYKKLQELKVTHPGVLHTHCCPWPWLTVRGTGFNKGRDENAHHVGQHEQWRVPRVFVFTAVSTLAHKLIKTFCPYMLGKIVSLYSSGSNILYRIHDFM